jgi:PDZ domain
MRSPATATCSRLAALLAAAAAAGCASASAPRPAPAAMIVAPSSPAMPVVVPNASALRRGIVSLRVTGQDWNARAPWEKQPPWTRTVTGLVVPGRHILAASTAFGNHLLVEAQKLGDESRTVARVSLVDQEGPLALVEVDDPAFWDGLEPLPLAREAPVEGVLTIHRWQRGGLLDSYPGTVRQVRSGRHGLSQTTLLTLEVATATDGLGGSEVVMADGHVAGLVTGHSGDTFAAIASPVLAQFLDGAEHGDWPGFARAGIAWQELTNPALREYLGLGPGESGVRITRVAPNGSAGGALQPGDVLLELGGAKLDAQGRYEHPRYGKTLMALLFTDGRRPGDTLVAKVLRDGRRLEVPLTLKRMAPEEEKVPPYQFGRGPGYVVVGGLVFQELTRSYLGAWGDWTRRAPPRLLIALDREGEVPDPAAPRIILLSSVLPDPANLGFQDLRDLIVSRIDGRAIGSLDDVREAVRHPGGAFHVIELLPGQAAARVVIAVDEARAAAARLQAAYGIERLDSAEVTPDRAGAPAGAASGAR